MITTPRILTLADYLAYEDDTNTFYELEAGALVSMPPEHRINDRIAMVLLQALMTVLPPEHLSCKGTEVEVTGSRATVRLPDLLVLTQELASLLENQSRATIFREMPPPLLVVEIVSPGKDAADRDYRYKRSEYGARGIPEYWIVDPIQKQVTVLTLVDGFYEAVAYGKGSKMTSLVLPEFTLSVDDALGL